MKPPVSSSLSFLSFLSFFSAERRSCRGREEGGELAARAGSPRSIDGPSCSWPTQGDDARDSASERRVRPFFLSTCAHLRVLY
ncbi:hypothetical protein HOP50_04g30510 [Chloropicon primus]|nr:hypothetical protein HOP50_04g30510 [Chloropicon primus]